MIINRHIPLPRRLSPCIDDMALRGGPRRPCAGRDLAPPGVHFCGGSYNDDRLWHGVLGGREGGIGELDIRGVTLAERLGGAHVRRGVGFPLDEDGCGLNGGGTPREPRNWHSTPRHLL